MRRPLVIALLATAALVAWVFWRPARAVRPAARPARTAPATGTAAVAVPRATVALAHVDRRLPAARGMCGTEILRPLRGAAPRRVPEELAALATGVPRAAAVAAAAAEWAITVPDGLDLAERLAGVERGRAELQADLTRPPDPDDEDQDDLARGRARALRDLGRSREALPLWRTEYDRSPTGPATLALASVLDDTNQPAAARQLLEAELERATHDHGRVWLHAQLGFLCATRGDLACAQRSTRELERLDAPQGLATFTRAVERTSAGDFAAARAAYLESLERGRDFATVNNLAEVEGCMGLQAESRQRWVGALDHGDGPDQQAGVLAGIALTHLREGEVAPAWIMASAALVAGGSGAHSTDARMALSLTALTMGDLGAARAQIAAARAADPDDDLQRRRCFAHPAEGDAVRALMAEARGDLEAARDAWVAVARSGHAALAAAARDALGAICP